MLDARTLRGTVRWLSLAGAGLAFVLGAGALDAQEASQGLTVGTYDPSRVAQQTGLQQRMMQRMQGLQQRMSEAQQQGDRQEMQNIQNEAEQARQDMAQQFQEALDEVMPQVAEEADIQIIAVDVAYAAEGVNEKDVTESVIAKLDDLSDRGEGGNAGDAGGETPSAP